MFSSKSSAYSTKNREDAFILADMLENSAGNHPARELDVQSFFYNYLRNLIIQSSSAITLGFSLQKAPSSFYGISLIIPWAHPWGNIAC